MEGTFESGQVAGEILDVAERFLVTTGEGVLEILALSYEDKEMTIDEFRTLGAAHFQFET